MARKEIINYRDPPLDLEFKALFAFIFDRGLGNKLTRNGSPVPWTADTLEEAFFVQGNKITDRAIENWHSGASMPRRSNLHALATLVSNDPDLRRKWTDALLASVKAANEAAVRRGNELDQNDVLALETPKSTFDTLTPEHRSSLTKFRPNLLFAMTGSFLLGGVFVGVFAFSIYKQAERARLLRPAAENIRFCNEDQFSSYSKDCLTNMASFPSDTKIIYVSFDIPDELYGQRMTRTWFLNGDTYLVKDSAFDEIWSGYTYLSFKNQMTPGNWALRIAIGDHLASGKFTVATPHQ